MDRYDIKNMRLQRTERLSSQISKMLLSEIQTGHYLPGDRLPSEAELAQRFGVSRTILREAIASLKNDDIVESKQGRGLLVKNPQNRQAFRFSDVFETISKDEIIHFYEIRASLESEAAALAAIRYSDEDKAEILAALDEMKRAIVENTSGNAAHERYNHTIAKASHNPIIIEFLSFLHGRLYNLAKDLRIRTMSSHERAETVFLEHKLCVESILSRDSEKARFSVLVHLKNAARRAGFEIYT